MHTHIRKNEMALVMQYFVLKPEGDDEQAEASRQAMLTYADVIQRTDPNLASDLRFWVQRHHNPGKYSLYVNISKSFRDKDAAAAARDRLPYWVQPGASIVKIDLGEEAKAWAGQAPHR